MRELQPGHESQATWLGLGRGADKAEADRALCAGKPKQPPQQSAFENQSCVSGGGWNTISLKGINIPEQEENQTSYKAQGMFKETTPKLRLILRRGVFRGYVFTYTY